MNGNHSSLILKIIGLVCAILVPVTGGYFSALSKMRIKHGTAMTEIAVLKDDIKWSLTTYKADKDRNRDDFLKLEREIKEELKNVSRAEDSMKIILQEILSRLTVIEHELKIGSRK